jgi:hypothetical protein
MDCWFVAFESVGYRALHFVLYGTNPLQTLQMLEEAYGEVTTNKMQVYEWRQCCRDDRPPLRVTMTKQFSVTATLQSLVMSFSRAHFSAPCSLATCLTPTSCTVSGTFWSEVKLIYDRRSVGQSVLVSGSHLEPITRFLFSVWQLRVSWCVAPSLTRGRVCNLLVQLFLVLARAVTLVIQVRVILRPTVSWPVCLGVVPLLERVTTVTFLSVTITILFFM